jgi:phytoene synthase
MPSLGVYTAVILVVAVHGWTTTTTIPLMTSRAAMTRLHSLAPAERESGARDTEVESGRYLEGGKVLDFSSVKASEKAEEALANARKRILESKVGLVWDSAEILGINSDVIGEVGHPLGEFATAQEVQDCATWMRSTATWGLFQPSPNAPSDASAFGAADVEKFQTILDKSFEEAGEVTSAFAKTFYMGTMLMDEKAREAIWAVYVWCRRTDEIVDAPRESNEEMLHDLSAWELRLENLWASGEVVDVYDLTLLHIRAQYPTLDITPFMDMIRGMLMDVPELGRDRYDRFDELHLYCYRVAGTVGLMSLPVFGCAPGFTDEIAR